MKSAGITESLQKFGFSEKEAAIYEATLDLGEAKASEIASAANVSTRYAYEVGERLEERGFLTMLDHLTPTVIRARSPDAVISTFEHDLSELKPALETRYADPGERDSDIEVIKASSTLRKRLQEAIRDANENIALCIPESVLSTLVEDLRAAKDRGVCVLLVTDAAETVDITNDIVDVHRIDPNQTTSLLVIDRTSMIVTAKSMLTTVNGNELALAGYEKRLSSLLFGGFSSCIWNVAKEQFVTDPVQLPATYSNFMPGLLHATLHYRAGRNLHVEASGTFTDADGEYVTIRGPLDSIDQALLDSAGNAQPIHQAINIQTDDGVVSIVETTGNQEPFIADTLTLYEE